MGNKERRNKIWFKINGKELWFSPQGTFKEFFLTDKKITKKEIKNWQNSQQKLIK